jgi:peroxiredoxin
MRWLQSLLLLLAFALPAFAGNAAPDFKLRDLENKEVSLSGLKGKVVVMSFWATWCQPCKAEMPHLQAMYNELKDKGLVVLGISADDARTSSGVRPVVAAAGVKYPVLLDTQTQVVGLYNPSKTLPFTVIVDRAGNVAESHSGFNNGDEVALKAKVLELLGQTTP